MQLKTFSLMSITFFYSIILFPVAVHDLVTQISDIPCLKEMWNEFTVVYIWTDVINVGKIERFHMQISWKEKNVEKENVGNVAAVINAKRLYVLSSTSYTIDIHWIFFYFRFASLVCLGDKSFNVERKTSRVKSELDIYIYIFFGFCSCFCLTLIDCFHRENKFAYDIQSINSIIH